MYKKSGFVYAICFSNGVTKIGMAKRDPSVRLRFYSQYCSLNNTSESSRWVSPLLAEARKTELEMIAYCKKNAVHHHGLEWFSSVDFEALVSAVTNIMVEATDADIKNEINNQRVHISKISDAMFKQFAMEKPDGDVNYASVFYVEDCLGLNFHCAALKLSDWSFENKTPPIFIMDATHGPVQAWPNNAWLEVYGLRIEA
jgi:hypothetical protein